MDPMSLKRTFASESQGYNKILKTEESFNFPVKPTLYSDDMAVVKYLFELQGRFIPFKTSGRGQMFVTNELLALLYEKRENDPHGKVECGISIFPVPEFDDTDVDQLVRATKSQEHWKKEIGSFLAALKEIDEPISYVVSPFWYKKLNWKSLHTICTISSMEHDIYVNFSHDEEFEWHLVP